MMVVQKNPNLRGASLQFSTAMGRVGRAGQMPVPEPPRISFNLD